MYNDIMKELLEAKERTDFLANKNINTKTGNSGDVIFLCWLMA